MNIEQLNADYGIVNQVKFSEGGGGFPLVEVSNKFAQATISLYAGHILSFKPVGQAEDAIFVSSKVNYQAGKAIRGGAPICWPWFGPDPEGKGRPNHGFARNSFWQMREVVTTAEGAIQIVLGLVDTPETRAIWDYSFDLAIAITVGQVLTVDLITHNTGSQKFSITQALHTYFKIGDIDQVTVLGLKDCDYLDKVDGGQQKTQTEEVTFSGECDRIYLEVPPELVIDDPALNRKIKVTAKNSTTAIVWNPAAKIAEAMADMGDLDYQHFVCVETANAAQEIIEIAPGDRYIMSAQYAVSAA
ncbi:MAG: D-hexose-6-phosphate mutarotase [Cyanobacteria bacterium J06621_8]